jgi:phage tail tape-measure protein
MAEKYQRNDGKNGKDPEKSVDLPPYGSRNPDPITDTAGSHPIETGVGAVVGGVASGLAVGAAGGPVGAVVGAIIGGTAAGGLAGKGVGELIDPTTEDNWIREYLDEHRSDSKIAEAHRGAAYRFGVRAETRYPTSQFDFVEPQLEADWDQLYPDGPAWNDVKGFARDGFARSRDLRNQFQ